MIEINYFDKKTTCCFTGHRVLKKDFNYEKLDETIESLIKKGYRTFLVGMAIGFDIECAKILLNKRKYNIDIVACIPCREQQKYFNKKQKEEYLDVLSKVDKKVYISNEYTKTCMRERNFFMVDNSSVLVAYYYCRIGGTHITVNYAERKNLEIIYLD